MSLQATPLHADLPLAKASVRARVAPAAAVPVAMEPPREHLAWVVSEARRMARRLGRDVRAEEFLGAGCEGLMVATAQFDAARCPSLEGFARMKIRAAILDELREQDRLPRRARTALKRLQREERAFSAEHGRLPERGELGARVGLCDGQVEALRQMEVAAQSPESLDAAVAVAAPSSEDPCERAERLAALATALGRLSARHQAVLAGYYQADMTFRELGAQLGVTESRVCQLHKEALRALRGFL